MGKGRHNPAFQSLSLSEVRLPRVRYSAPRGIGVAAYTHMCTGVSGKPIAIKSLNPDERTRASEIRSSEMIEAAATSKRVLKCLHATRSRAEGQGLLISVSVPLAKLVREIAVETELYLPPDVGEQLF